MPYRNNNCYITLVNSPRRLSQFSSRLPLRHARWARGVLPIPPLSQSTHKHVPVDVRCLLTHRMAASPPPSHSLSLSLLPNVVYIGFSTRGAVCFHGNYKNQTLQSFMWPLVSRVLYPSKTWSWESPERNNKLVHTVTLKAAYPFTAFPEFFV